MSVILFDKLFSSRELDNARSTIIQLQRSIDRLTDERDTALEQVEQLKADINNYRLWLAEANNEIKFSKNELNKINSDISQEKNITQSYYEQYIDATKTIEILENDLKVLQEKYSSLKNEHKCLKSQLNQNTTAEDTDPIQLNTEPEAEQTYKAKAAKLEHSYATLFKQYTAIEDREQKLQTELEETRATNYKNNFESAQAHIEYLERSLCQVQKALEESRIEQHILSEELSIYKNYIIKPEETVNEATDSLYMSKDQAEIYIDSIGESRFNKSFIEDLKLTRPYAISCKVVSNATGEVYTTSLKECTCTDFKYHKKPCKHMIALALSVKAFSPTKAEIDRKLKSLAIEQHRKELLYTEKMNKAQNEIRKASRELKTANEIKAFINSKVFTYPYLAELISYYKTARLDVTVKSSVTKRELTSLIKRTEKENALLRNKIAIYEYMFPNLQELKEVEPEKIVAMADDISHSRLTYQWLSPEEYATLTNSEKQNLFLKNYFAKKSKNAWEAGIKYERYIGYLCEKEGYKIQYTGATLRLNDMGRDLIVSKGNCVYVIQCKRHAKTKQIHENHLFQLFGSIHEYAKSNEKKKVTGVFVTTTTLSDVAMECARCLNIEVFENVDFKEYPLIKCNISRNKERIYHLPYDQQYDNVKMSFDGEEFYAATIEEAERAGFRHAHKYLGS